MRVHTRWFIYIKFHDAIKYKKWNKEMFEKMGFVEYFFNMVIGGFTF
jgi:hypothetical protein